jgi:hypothetical protein
MDQDTVKFENLARVEEFPEEEPIIMLNYRMIRVGPLLIMLDNIATWELRTDGRLYIHVTYKNGSERKFSLTDKEFYALENALRGYYITED